MDLKGKNILITGGRRVGQVVADELAAAGANIAMTYRKSRAEIAQEVDHLKTAHPVRAEAYEVDMTDEGSIRMLVKTVTKDFGSIDALVNMASIYETDPKDISASEVLRLFSVNAIGGMLLSRWIADEARARKAKNVPIVSFIDWAVDHPYADYDLYLASKAALRHYLMALQTTFAGTVRIVNIHPGMILQPEGFPASRKKEIVANTPVGQIGDPQQAARLVRVAMENDFLVDNIYLDGGQHWRHRL